MNEEPSQSQQVIPQDILNFADDDSFLAALKVPVIQRPDEASVVAGIRSYLANRCGFFNVMEKILDMMETAADAMKRPIDGARYAEMHKMVVNRDYADVLAAIGSNGTAQFLGPKRRKDLLRKVEEVLLPAMGEFHEAASIYRAELLSNLQGTGLMAMVPGVMDQLPPEMRAALISVPKNDNLLLAAEVFVNRVNQTFAGFGEAAARVLAQDGVQIKKALKSDDLHQFTGHVDRESMLKALGVDVTASDVQQEQDLAAYAVLILRLNNPAYAQKRLELLTHLWQLDGNITWTK